MPNYKQMYLTLMGATESAINALISAQRSAEEIYISEADSESGPFVHAEEEEPKAD